jgi:hypothetical protein
MMKRLFLVAVLATFAAGSAFAQETCETKAVGKDGKALAGAAKTSLPKRSVRTARRFRARPRPAS